MRVFCGWGVSGRAIALIEAAERMTIRGAVVEEYDLQ